MCYMNIFFSLKQREGQGYFGRNAHAPLLTPNQTEAKQAEVNESLFIAFSHPFCSSR